MRGGSPNHKNRPRGIRHGMAKLTEGEVIQIRRRFGQGYTMRALAYLYFVSHTVIRYVFRRKTWTHV